ncbi:aminoglycoside phosphotransferase [Streptomyces sp. NPDC020983]|uniref:aminoglycoside phosphotransferase n=1 Tax=Streptomyces sp. NPDC020983 TaxID=3365106 RepID=UPI00379D0011
MGAVLDATPVAHGLTCHMAAVLTTADGRVFVKGVSAGDAEGMAGQSWETAVNPLVAGVAPLMLARVTAGGWDVLIFECVDGRHADLSPESPDVALVTKALQATQDVAAGGLAPRLADRFGNHLDDAGRLLLAGDALLHTDTDPQNMLIAGDRAYMADWAKVAAGPAWVDVAYMAVLLMEAGWPSADALDWARQFESWRRADPVAVHALVAATCRAGEARFGEAGAQPGKRRFQALLARDAAA